MTNGITLAKQLPGLVDAGLSSMNLSLDTLNEDKFAKLTRRPATYMSRVWQALEMAVMDYGVDGNGTTGKKLITKLNCVVQRGVNDDEIADFIALTDQFPGLQVRFIEYMPFTDNGWNQNLLVPYKEHLEQLELQGIFTAGTGRSSMIPPGFVPPRAARWIHQHESLCAGCNRLRLSTDGQIKVCLTVIPKSVAMLFDKATPTTGQVDLRCRAKEALRLGWTQGCRSDFEGFGQ
jgi:cyclic pyranopterin phosphate synthase